MKKDENRDLLLVAVSSQYKVVVLVSGTERRERESRTVGLTRSENGHDLVIVSGGIGICPD